MAEENNKNEKEEEDPFFYHLDLSHYTLEAQLKEEK
jgi:hypothetical protein